MVDALFAPWTPKVHPLLLALAGGCALVVAGLVVLVKARPFLQFDADVDRAIQSVNYGPLSATFPFFSWVGGPGGGIYMQVASILIVLRRSPAPVLAPMLALYPVAVWLTGRDRAQPGDPH